jgi:membrane-associated phospholipid phosphatase
LHEADALHAEKWLFGGVEPTVWLQQHLYDAGNIHWYDALCSVVYSSHFLVTPALAAILWLGNRPVWVRYISRVVAVSTAALVTYCVFPEAPPWLAAQDGLTTAVPRLSARGWVWFHLGGAKVTLATAQREGSNPVAAMPSLHTALAVLAAIFVITRLRSRWRWLAVLYPVAMGFTLVYCGEHYVIDLVAGVAYAFATHWAIGMWERRRAARKAVREPRAVRERRAVQDRGGAPEVERIPTPVPAASDGSDGRNGRVPGDNPDVAPGPSRPDDSGDPGGRRPAPVA